MQKKFSCPDFFSKKIKAEKTPDPEPVAEVIEAAERPAARPSDRPKPSTLHKIHSAPYLIAGAVIFSIVLSVALLASPGKNGGGTARQGGSTGVPPVFPTGGTPVLPAGTGWTEHKRAEEAARQAQAAAPAPPANVVVAKPAEPGATQVKQAPKNKPEPIREVIYRDPEHDLFDFIPASVPPPATLSKELKEADQLLDRGRELMRSWDSSRASESDGARKTILDARHTFEKAIAAYHAAATNAANDGYIKSQLEVANKLYYLAMKSSPL